MDKGMNNTTGNATVILTTFKEFCDIIRDGIASGEIETSAELSDLDLAVLYAIDCEMMERGGGELMATTEEIYDWIGKYCGIDERERLFNTEAQE